MVVESFRAGVIDRLGLSWESLHELNPKLAYGAVRGFGDPRTDKNPYADWPAYDVIAQAMGEMMTITGPIGREPTKIGPGRRRSDPRRDGGIRHSLGRLSRPHHGGLRQGMCSLECAIIHPSQVKASQCIFSPLQEVVDAASVRILQHIIDKVDLTCCGRPVRARFRFRFAWREVPCGA